VLFRAKTSAKVAKSRAIARLSPNKSKTPIGTETVIAAMQAMATNKPVSLSRIDQSRDVRIYCSPLRSLENNFALPAIGNPC